MMADKYRQRPMERSGEHGGSFLQARRKTGPAEVHSHVKQIQMVKIQQEVAGHIFPQEYLTEQLAQA